MDRQRALFVSTSNALGRGTGPKGGVQLCTNEYLAVARQAGLDVSLFEFDVDRRLVNRAERMLRRRPYHHVLPPGIDGEVRDTIAKSGAQIVFLNVVDLAPLARPIREHFGSRVQIVLLSHGLGSADILHDLRLRHLSSGRDLQWLGGHLVAECEQRRFIDHVFCLSEFDVGLERWVGAGSVSWLPRLVTPNPLAWSPVAGRLGFVGTLDHSPTLEGLELFLNAARLRAGVPFRLRVVGGPVESGERLAGRYRAVDYLGPLDDAGLVKEAATWECAVHPLFCHARGCSTKLAILLGWQIPIVTTEQGRRGYTWREGDIPRAADPKSFVRLVEQIRSSGAATRDAIVKVSESSPTITEVAALMREPLARS